MFRLQKRLAFGRGAFVCFDSPTVRKGPNERLNCIHYALELGFALRPYLPVAPGIRYAFL